MSNQEMIIKVAENSDYLEIGLEGVVVMNTNVLMLFGIDVENGEAGAIIKIDKNRMKITGEEGRVTLKQIEGR